MRSPRLLPTGFPIEAQITRVAQIALGVHGVNRWKPDGKWKNGLELAVHRIFEAGAFSYCGNQLI